MFITVIFILIASHFIGDYIIYPNFLIINKRKDNVLLVVHCIIYTAFILIGFTAAAIVLGLNLDTVITKFPNIIALTFITHFSIDKWKCESEKKLIDDTHLSIDQKKKMTKQLIYSDMILHIIVVCMLFAVEIKG